MTDPTSPTLAALPEHLVAPAAIDVVEVTGADRLAYLDDLLTQRLVDARPGQVFGALELEQHGSVLALVDVAVLEDRVLLLVPRAAPRDDTPRPLTPPGQTPPDMPDLATSVAVRMGARTFLKDARFALRPDLVVVREAGPDLTRAAGEAGPSGVVVPVGPDRWTLTRGGVHDHVTVDAEAVVADRVAAGAELVDTDVLDVLRVVRGEPGWGREVVAPHLPEELGLLTTHVHLAKGCYPGQEAVARMWMLGRPRRRLAGFDLADGVVVPVQLGSGKHKVTVTSSVVVAGEGIGLGFVGPAAEVGDAIEDEGGRMIRVAWIAPDDRSVPGHDPAVTRRRDR